MSQYKSTKVQHWQPQVTQPRNFQLLGEEPLAIRIQGRPYVVIMRTPGDESAHAAGFILSEGIVDTLADIKNIASCDGENTNVVTVTLTDGRYRAIADQMDRREYVSQTSCGICGKQLVEDLHQDIRPIDRDIRLPAATAFDCLESLDVHQSLRHITRASHAAIFFDAANRVLAVAEDVGRHNALDKAIGRLFLDDRLKDAAFVVLSSRISYELVQKAARARIPIILGASYPTALAAALAAELNITLVCLAKEGGLLVFTAPWRIQFQDGVTAMGAKV